jgi:hypothetical protein
MEASSGTQILMVPVAALIGGAFILSVLWMIVRNGLREREMEHLERLKALEVGMPLPGDGPWWTPNKLAAGIGVGVPFIAFLAAFLTTLGYRGEHDIAIWVSAAAVSVASVISGTVLAVQMPRAAAPQPRPMTSHSKPEFDPDSYDTAGRRG